MIRRSSLLPLLLPTLFVVAACGDTSDSEEEIAAPTPIFWDTDDSKADNVDDNVEVIETDEPLRSGVLEQLACDAIADFYGSSATAAEVRAGCDGHTYTVTTIYASKRYDNADDGSPLVLGLDVRVDSTAPVGTWNVALRRAVSDNFTLAWTAEVQPSTGDADQLIAELAAEAGEGFDPSDPAVADYLTAIDFSELPAHMQQLAIDTIDNERELGQWTTVEILEQYEIRVDGEVIGFVLVFDYYFDGDPRFSGAGSFKWYNAAGQLIDAYDWTG